MENGIKTAVLAGDVQPWGLCVWHCWEQQGSRGKPQNGTVCRAYGKSPRQIVSDCVVQQVVEPPVSKTTHLCTLTFLHPNYLLLAYKNTFTQFRAVNVLMLL